MDPAPAPPDAGRPTTPAVGEEWVARGATGVVAPHPSSPHPSAEGAVGVEGYPALAGAPAPEDAEARNRAFADRRDLVVAGAVAVGAVGIAWFLDLIALLFVVAAAQVTAVVLTSQKSTTKGRRGVTGLPRSSLTTMGRVGLPATWVVVIGAILLQLPVLRWWACVLFALTLAAWPLGRLHLSRIRVSRALERRARVGAPSAVVWTVRNAGRLAARGLLVEDRLGPLTRPAFVRVEFDLVPSQGSARATTAFVPERRGRKRLRPVRLTSVYPLGLFQTSIDLAAPAEVLVRPREGRATGALLDRLRGVSAETSAATNRSGHDEFYGLRPFRDGDDPRGIHWRTSARRGALTFVERREESHREVVLCLARNPRKGPVADSGFERAVSVAATVARAAMRLHLRVRLVLGEPDAQTPRPLRGMGGLASILDTLAEVRGDGGRRPLAVLRGLCERAGAHPAHVVWVASESEPGLASTLIEVGARDALLLCADDPALKRFIQGLR